METIKSCICCGRNVPSLEDIFCEGYFCRFNQCKEMVENVRCIKPCLTNSNFCETHTRKRYLWVKIQEGNLTCKCCSKMAKTDAIFCDGFCCPRQCSGYTGGKRCQNIFSIDRSLCFEHAVGLHIEKYIFEPYLCICGRFVRGGLFCEGTHCPSYQCRFITKSGRCPNRVDSTSSSKCHIHGKKYKKDKDV
jgi:hypothetical protein